jgi:hypothetical protein
MPNHVKMSITRRIAMFTDQDIFITNTTSTYQNIPQDCKLVGAEFDQNYQPDSIHLNKEKVTRSDDMTSFRNLVFFDSL